MKEISVAKVFHCTLIFAGKSGKQHSVIRLQLASYYTKLLSCIEYNSLHFCLLAFSTTWVIGLLHKMELDHDSGRLTEPIERNNGMLLSCLISLLSS